MCFDRDLLGVLTELNTGASIYAFLAPARVKRTGVINNNDC